MPSRSRAALVLLFLLGMAQSARAQQRPLTTEDVDIIGPGSMRIEAGIDFLQGALNNEKAAKYFDSFQVLKN